MKLITRALAHKTMRRGIKKSIREYQRHLRLKHITGMAAAYSPARTKVKGMKKKFIYRMKAGVSA